MKIFNKIIDYTCNPKITRKHIQTDYDEVYLGPPFLMENSFSIVNYQII